MRKKLIYLTLAVSSLGLTACVAPDTKTMTESGQEIRLSPEQSLQAYTWHLTQIVRPDGQTEPAWHSDDPAYDQPLNLSFSDHTVAIQGLCNVMNAGYSLHNSQIHFNQAAGTMKMCADPELMRYERQVAQLLPTATTWSLAAAAQGAQNTQKAAPVLTLHFDNGDVWRLAGEQTYKNKYGSKPERVFLEVAAKTEICPQSGQSCLRVRPVHYDAQGLQIGHGEWALFPPTLIEGYTHEPGISNIVRTERYQVKDMTDQQKHEIYVLDMVVQSTQE